MKRIMCFLFGHKWQWHGQQTYYGVYWCKCLRCGKREAK